MEELFLVQEERINILSKKVDELINDVVVMYNLHEDKNKRIRILESEVALLKLKMVK